MRTIKKKYDLSKEEIDKQVHELLQRYPKLSDMEAKCKCCANCPNWNVDGSLMNRYVHNTCTCLGTATMVKCCLVCNMYSGSMKEENIPAYELIISDDGEKYC